MGSEGFEDAEALRRSTLAVAAALEAGRDELAERWVARLPELQLPRRLSHEEALDSMPEVLEALVHRITEEVRSQDSQPLLRGCELAQLHGAQRFQLGFSLDTMVGEYLILRDELLKLVHAADANASSTDFRIVTDFVVAMLAQAIEAHALCRERDIHEHQPASFAKVRNSSSSCLP